MTEIESERRAFEKLLPEILDEHRGEFVVVMNGELHGFHRSFDAAYASAVAEFGPDATFLVTEVDRQDPQPVSLSWSVGALVG